MVALARGAAGTPGVLRVAAFKTSLLSACKLTSGLGKVHALQYPRQQQEDSVSDGSTCADSSTSAEPRCVWS